MPNIAKQIEEWDIETIEKILDQYDAYLSESKPSAANGMELFKIARRAARLVRVEKEYNAID